MIFEKINGIFKSKSIKTYRATVKLLLFYAEKDNIIKINVSAADAQRASTDKCIM